MGSRETHRAVAVDARRAGVMKERSIIFGTESVRATLNGLKTQTRRVIKPSVKGCTVGAYTGGDTPIEPVNVQEDGDPWTDIPCPYGQPGDLLWVKEPYYRWDGSGTGKSVIYCADGAWIDWGREPVWRGSMDLDSFFGGKKTSSRYMPRWASRLTPIITDIRAERVQDISQDDS